MLNEKELSSAVEYNSRQFKSSDSLPWPWSGVKPWSESFAWVTEAYQTDNGLKADGKLGPKTASKLNNHTTITAKPILSKIKLKDGEFSNALIVNGHRIGLPQSFIDAGLTASNYIDDGEPHFRHRRRSVAPIHFVLHETCGNTASGCKRTLLRKGFGVQLIMDNTGHISCHGDLVLDHMTHANQLNKTSFGIEMVNPYSPLYAREGGAFSRTVPAEWWTWVPSTKMKGVKELLKRKGWSRVPREYVTLTDAQMEAARKLVPWICHISGVPYRFPTKGLNRKKPHIEGWDAYPKAKPGSGVVAHRDFSTHADARYMLDDLIGLSNK